MHELNKNKLPKALQSCNWQFMTRETLKEGWKTGTRLLVAIPMDVKDDWQYELFVVTITYNNYVKCGDKFWWWLDCVDWFLNLNE